MQNVDIAIVRRRRKRSIREKHILRSRQSPSDIQTKHTRHGDTATFHKFSNMPPGLIGKKLA